MSTVLQQTSYVGFWRRLLAFWLDQLMLLAITSPFIYLFSANANLITEFLISYLIPFALVIIFWVKLGATPGKLLMECRIVDAKTGKLPTFKQALIRLLGYFISYITFGIGFLWMIWDRRKQGLHDKIAGTLVIEEPEISLSQQVHSEHQN